MDFVDWCELVLANVIEASHSSPHARMYGVDAPLAARTLFGEAVSLADDFRGSTRNRGIHDALSELERVDLLEEHTTAHWSPTNYGLGVVANFEVLWQLVGSPVLRDDQRELLGVVNRLSPKPTDDHSWIELVEQNQLQIELGWPTDLLWAVSKELDRSLFVSWQPIAGNLRLRGTYSGLVWETRRRASEDYQFMDGLISGWETTSVDFKRELRTKTADEKAEFIKDVLGLANTQASGRRWLIIGFEDRSRSYFGPPDSRLDQDHLEQVLAAYTDPPVEIRYRLADYRSGLVGVLEVVRRPEKLPYQVRKSVGDGKRIQAGQIFVRHGSQTEQPTPRELESLISEGERARRSPL